MTAFAMGAIAASTVRSIPISRLISVILNRRDHCRTPLSESKQRHWLGRNDVSIVG